MKENIFLGLVFAITVVSCQQHVPDTFPLGCHLVNVSADHSRWQLPNKWMDGAYTFYPCYIFETPSEVHTVTLYMQDTTTSRTFRWIEFETKYSGVEVFDGIGRNRPRLKYPVATAEGFEVAYSSSGRYLTLHLETSIAKDLFFGYSSARQCQLLRADSMGRLINLGQDVQLSTKKHGDFYDACYVVSLDKNVYYSYDLTLWLDDVSVFQDYNGGAKPSLQVYGGATKVYNDQVISMGTYEHGYPSSGYLRNSQGSFVITVYFPASIQPRGSLRYYVKYQGFWGQYWFAYFLWITLLIMTPLTLALLCHTCYTLCTNNKKKRRQQTSVAVIPATVYAVESDIPTYEQAVAIIDEKAPVVQ